MGLGGAPCLHGPLTASPSLHLGIAGVIRHALLMHGLHWLREWTTRQDQQGAWEETARNAPHEKFKVTENVHQSHQALTEPPWPSLGPRRGPDAYSGCQGMCVK